MAEVKINITADGAQAAAEISKVKSAAESFSAMTEAHKGRNDNADQSNYLSNITAEAKATAESGKAAAKAALSKKDLKDAVQSASHAFPGLSAALVLLKNPYVIIVAAIAGFISALKNQMDAQDEAARKSAALATSLGPLFEQFRKATTIAEAAAAARAYADAMEDSYIASQTSLTQLNSENTAQETANRLLKAKTDLQRESARNSIKRDQATGAITGEEAAAKLKVLGGQFANEDAAAAIAAQVAESARIDKAARDAAARRDAIGAALPSAEESAADAARREKDYKAKAEQSAAIRKQRREELEKEIADQELVIAKAQQDMSGAPTQALSQAFGPSAWQAQNKMEQLVAEQKQLQISDDAQAAKAVKLASEKESSASYVKTLRGAHAKASGEAADLTAREAAVANQIAAARASEAVLAPMRAGNAATEADTGRIESLKRLATALSGEEQEVWGEVVASVKEGHLLRAEAARQTLDTIRAENADIKRQINQLQARGPQ